MPKLSGLSRSWGERWKMFSKLAFRNVRRSFRDYGVYLLTLTFGVCL